MASYKEMIIGLADQECLTGSWNGPALVETLRSITPAEAASTDTYEGYSAWTSALHVLYFKHMVADELGATVPEYTYEKVSFPSPPENKNQEAWDRLISEIESTHTGLMEAVRSASDKRLNEQHAALKAPLWNSLMWTISHDTNHNTQIRNMGLPTLRKPVN